jgi:hypothetical protein
MKIHHRCLPCVVYVLCDSNGDEACQWIPYPSLT